MTTSNNITKTVQSKSPKTAPAAQSKEKRAHTETRRRTTRRRPFSSSREGGGTRPEFLQKVLKVRRVTRVVAGGRRFSFSVVMVVGDKKGSVGVGIGKASDTPSAIGKAIQNAKKNMLKVKTNKYMSIPHEVRAKYSSTDVFIIPVPGKGLVAGSAVRVVLDLAGITDVTAKILSRSKNHLNNARATIKALKQLE